MELGVLRDRQVRAWALVINDYAAAVTATNAVFIGWVLTAHAGDPPAV